MISHDTDEHHFSCLIFQLRTSQGLSYQPSYGEKVTEKRLRSRGSVTNSVTESVTLLCTHTTRSNLRRPASPTRARGALSGLSGQPHVYSMVAGAAFGHPRVRSARVRPNFLNHMSRICPLYSCNAPRLIRLVDTVLMQCRNPPLPPNKFKCISVPVFSKRGFHHTLGCRPAQLGASEFRKTTMHILSP